MSEAKYEVLIQESKGLIDSEIPWVYEEKSKRKWQLPWVILATVLLVISIALNILAYLLIGRTQGSATIGFTVPHEMNIPIAMPHDTRTLYDEVWDDPRWDYQAGFLALDSDFEKKHNLPETQRWPWNTSNGIYFLKGWHSMHCVLSLREAIIALDKNTPMPHKIGHFTHCLHVLREDTECFADDTPMYTGAFNAEVGHRITHSGHGQTRLCRNWDLVRQFGLEHSACFDARAAGINVPEIEKYKFCPDGNKPWL